MDVNRSGYYKWRKRQGTVNRYVQNRRDLTKLLIEEHKKHKAYGYHALARNIFRNTGWVFSDNLAHKCCKAAGIKSQAKNYRYNKPGAEHVWYPNLVAGKWNATKPLQIIVSDMTCIRWHGKLYEWVLFVDTFNNEIIAHAISGQRGNPQPYYQCLESLCSLIEKEQEEPTILHTDQGSTYSSRAFAQAHKNYNIIRSMSRAGTPTDNPIIESLNGWIKAELQLDFDIATTTNLEKSLNDYVSYYNQERLASALDYKTPVQYRTELGF